MGRAGKSRGRGWDAIGDVILVEKGPSRGSRPSFKPWRCWSNSSAPSTSSFLCLLDVRESRGAPRSCLGGPAFDSDVPSASMAGLIRSVVHSWCLSRFSSRASRKKRAARNCCCRRHERSGGPTVPDLNRLGLKRVLIARQSGTIKAGTPPGGLGIATCSKSCETSGATWSF